MVKLQKCTEMQFTLHIIIMFTIGLLIGTSIVTETDELETNLKARVEQGEEVYTDMKTRYYSHFDTMIKDYNLYRRYVYNGIEIKCSELSNYYIDNSTSNELTIDLIETFHKVPHIFMSVNGFNYNPHLSLSDGNKQEIEFHVMEKQEKSFKFTISSSHSEDGFFRLSDFDRIDICYFAFVKFDPEEDKS